MERMTDDERGVFRRFMHEMKERSAARRKATGKGILFSEVAECVFVEGILYARRRDAEKREAAALAEQEEHEHALAEAYRAGYETAQRELRKNVERATDARVARIIKDEALVNTARDAVVYGVSMTRVEVAALYADPAENSRLTSETPNDARMGWPGLRRDD